MLKLKQIQLIALLDVKDGEENITKWTLLIVPTKHPYNNGKATSVFLPSYHCVVVFNELCTLLWLSKFKIKKNQRKFIVSSIKKSW